MASATLALAEPYALGTTLFSGQAFRWSRDGGGYRGFAAGLPVRLSQQGDTLRLEGHARAGLEDALSKYLRVGDPMGKVYRAIGKDAEVAKAVRRWRGLHLLAQDPWETTACFIASSASNIPRITRNVESLCARFGRRVPAAWGPARLFPSARSIARASRTELLACGLGYRAQYLRSAARSISGGAIDLEAVRKEPTDRARQLLVESLDGVGPKVADCILLFSLGKDDAFPVDRWVQRRVAQLYHGGEVWAPPKVAKWGRHRWGRWAGYAQQYLFQDGRAQAGRPGDGQVGKAA